MQNDIRLAFILIGSLTVSRKESGTVTILAIIIFVGLLVWSGKALSRGNDGFWPGFIFTLSVLGIGGLVFAYCWKFLLGLVIVVVCCWITIQMLAALFSNADGGQTLKGIMVAGALILALPPFWPISIPLGLCLVGACFVLAPISLLCGAIKDFMEK